MKKKKEEKRRNDKQWRTHWLLLIGRLACRRLAGELASLVLGRTRVERSVGRTGSSLGGQELTRFGGKLGTGIGEHRERERETPQTQSLAWASHFARTHAVQTPDCSSFWFGSL